MKDLVMEILYGIRRFFIIGTGGYTRYSDYYKFKEKYEKTLAEIKARKKQERDLKSRIVENQKEKIGA